MSEGRERGKGELDQTLERNWRKALRASRMNGNIRSWRVRGGGTLKNVPKTWEVRDIQDSKRVSDLR
jgi:hypothetical protein